MSDIRARIVDIIGKPQLCILATVTADGLPWARYVMAVSDPRLHAIRFATFASARKVAQIEDNPEVHMTCGVSSPEDMKPYLQIQGIATVTTDEAERHRFWNPMLADIFDGPDDPRFAICIVKPYRIELCTPGVFEPEVWEAKAE